MGMDVSLRVFVWRRLRKLDDTEYREVIVRVLQFLAEIEMEITRGRATYAEVEESKADRDHFETADDTRARSDCIAAMRRWQRLGLARGDLHSHFGFYRSPPCVCGRDVIEVTHGLAAAARKGWLRLS